MEFPEFFRLATEKNPFPYQVRLATAELLPELLDIPTGLGKTAATVLAWPWERGVFDCEDWVFESNLEYSNRAIN